MEQATKTVTVHAAYFWRGEIIPHTIEVQACEGIGIHIVGLPDSVVKETLLRVVTAIQSLGYRIPGRKLVINIEPHGGRMELAGRRIRQIGYGGFDLAIAIGILQATGQIQTLPGAAVDDVLFYGELALDGRILAPEGGLLQDVDVARVIDWQLSRNWGLVVGFDADDDNFIIWRNYLNLSAVIQDINGNGYAL